MVVLDQEGMHGLEARCSQENPPRCQALCPFNVDARGVARLMAKGSLREARKLVQRTMPMPALFGRICDHPCEGGCLRKDLGGAVAMGELERHLVTTTGQQGGGLPIPKKRFSMGVVGLGVAGLVCAYDLSLKGYPVTCWHTGTPDSQIRALFPELDACWDDPTGPASEWKRFASKISFKQVESFDAPLLESAKEGLDAVFVDAGVCPFAPDRAKVDAETFQFEGKVCVSGWKRETPAGAPVVSASGLGGEGRVAAVTMERIASGVSLTAARQKDKVSPHMVLDGIAPAERVVMQGELFAKEEAVAEASRCLECQCMVCVKACAYMQKYKGYPRVFARMIFNNLTIAQGIRKANILINSCALCRQCEELCPERFSMADLCMAAREQMVDTELMPPSAFEFAVEDMESASGEQCRFAHPGKSGRKPAYVFFPGCQLAGCRPGQTEAVYSFLAGRLEGGVGVLLSCCGVPARWAGERKLFEAHRDSIRKDLESMGRPKIVTACSTCLSVFREFFPECESVSLWEVLDSLPLPEREGAAPLPETLVMQDPCGARNNPAWLEAARSLARKCGVNVAEPELSREKTACCGYGGNQWCSDPQAAEMMAKDRARNIDGPALASCIMCRDRLAEQGLACWHLLDLLPFGKPDQNAGKAGATGLSERRASRAALRRSLVRLLEGRELPAPAPAAVVEYADVALASLEKKHILQEDVEGTLAFGKSSGKFFFDEESGHYLTSWRPRNVTFWVEYLPRDDGSFLVLDAWCHRMRIPGAGGESPSSALDEESFLAREAGRK